MNLAMSLAEAGKRVLFVDADMRKSILTDRYKIKNAKVGLSHYLSGQCSIEDFVSSTNIEKLHMVVAGPVPPNPSELLESKNPYCDPCSLVMVVVARGVFFCRDIYLNG